MEEFMDTITTENLSIPRLGFGTFRMPGGGCQPVVESALALGNRHLDTAAMYDNEDAVGAAIAASGLSRSDIFVTTKVWHDQLGTRDSIRRAFEYQHWQAESRLRRPLHGPLALEGHGPGHRSRNAHRATGLRPDASDWRLQFQSADDAPGSQRDLRTGLHALPSQRHSSRKARGRTSMR
jgi:Aldo/keto reductase family